MAAGRPGIGTKGNRFFEPLGALLKTGPTQTNVCDLRVVLAVSPTTTDPCRDPA